MAKPGKGKIVVGTPYPQRVIEFIDARRDPLRWSRQEYLVALAEWWIDQAGAPGISPADHALQVLNEGKNPYGKKG